MENNFSPHKEVLPHFLYGNFRKFIMTTYMYDEGLPDPGRPHRGRTCVGPIGVSAQQRESLMTEQASFELSRIYAKGWSAGGDSSIVDSEDGLEATIAALNPYKIEEERARWALGFQDARRRAEEMASRSKSPKRNRARA
jgi:hypothetical protein